MSNGNVLEITDDNFLKIVETGVTLIDFWAPWCQPCMMQGPIIEKVAHKFDGHADVGKMNTDVSSATASQFGIRGIPTLILFKDGQEVERFVGVQMEQVLSMAINNHLAGEAADSFLRM